MRRTLISLFLILGIAVIQLGCGQKLYEEKLGSWLGHDVNDLITSWGPPSDTFKMPNGEMIYTWLWVGGQVMRTHYNEYTNQLISTSSKRWCKTSFTANQSNRIERWRWEGNACFEW